VNFADRFQIPILTTWPGMDLVPEDHELYCGRPGSIPSGWVPNFVNVECDFLLIFGARLDLGQVGYNPSLFAKNASVLRIDIDEDEFSRIPSRINWHNFLGDVADFESDLCSIMDSVPVRDFGSWWRSIRYWKSKYLKPGEIPQEIGTRVSTYKLVEKVSSVFQRSTIVTGSSGTSIEMLLQSWEVQEGQRIINSCGIGSMGFALAAAYGVAAKTKMDEIICIESDGSLLMNIQDFSSLMYVPTKVKIIVLDSDGYKSISLSQNRLKQFPHGNSPSNGLNLPDIQSIASAFGLETFRIDSNSQLDVGLQWLKNQKSTSLLLVKISEFEDALPRLISKPNPLGVLETPPMNDLYPSEPRM
jgi:acetolactate synthase-1/2/3 large subunit